METLANLPWLLRNGAAACTAIGTETSPGTRMVAVSGHVKRPGVFEIVNGTTTFRDLIYGEEYSAGIRENKKALQDVRAWQRVGAVVPSSNSTSRSRASPWAPPDRCSGRGRSW